MTPLLILGLLAGLVLLGLLLATVGPAMIGAQGLNQLGEEKTVILTNRTGAALTQYGVYAIDRIQSATESVDGETGAGNAVAVATANLHCDMAVAQGAYADDAAGLFIIMSPDTLVAVEGTTDITKGDVLIPINALAQLKTQSVTVLTMGVGLANEGFTTNGNGTIRAAFDGTNRFKSKAPVS